MVLPNNQMVTTLNFNYSGKNILVTCLGPIQVICMVSGAYYIIRRGRVSTK